MKYDQPSIQIETQSALHGFFGGDYPLLFKKVHIQADFVSYHFYSHVVLLDDLIVHIRLDLFAAQLSRFFLE